MKNLIAVTAVIGFSIIAFLVLKLLLGHSVFQGISYAMGWLCGLLYAAMVEIFKQREKDTK